MYCRVTGQIFRIIRLLEEDRKKPKDYGAGIPLSQAEVLFLETVEQYPDENVSALSLRLGITKGAVTQIVGKLCQKELLEVINRNDNKKEKYFRLTPKGEKTVRGHQLFHRHANRRLCNFVAALDPKEANTVFRFLECVRECVPFCEFPCECGTITGDDKEESLDETIAVTCTQPACRT